MQVRLTYAPYTLDFKFEAGTSRGVLHQHHIWLLRLSSPDAPDTVGVGEVAPLRGLSLDFRPDLEEILADLARKIAENPLPTDAPEAWIMQLVPDALPAVRFGLEMAVFDLLNGGKGIICAGDFARGAQKLVVNGLIWMGKPAFMQAQIEEKLAKGFRCIKMKIGAIDFEQEIELLKAIRARFSPEDVTLRVDANGAFSPTDALEKLKRLAELGLHSIEQPIRAGQVEEMARLCAETPLPIALDEELIPVLGAQARQKLLSDICPQYIILKPTLLGGLMGTREWIKLAQEANIDWWITSALESNIGLSAICQFAGEILPPDRLDFPQGLGTGSLYHNNLPTTLQMEADKIFNIPNGN